MISASDAMMANIGVADYTTAYREGGLVLDAVTESGTTNTTSVSAEEFWTTVAQFRNGWANFFTYSLTNVRLRELSIGYNFNVTKIPYIKKASIALAGRNLFFLYKGKTKMDIPGLGKRSLPLDPDQAASSDTFQGVEAGLLPATRTFSFSVNLTF